MLISGIPIDLGLTQVINGPTNLLTVTWPSAQGESYQIDTSSNLVAWTRLTTVTNAPGPLAIYEIPFGANTAPMLFFHVGQIPSP
jgi:hypothetical protein